MSIKKKKEFIKINYEYYLLKTASSVNVRAIKGTDGNSLRVSFMTQSKYFNSTKSSWVGGRSEDPKTLFSSSMTLSCQKKS